MSYKHRFEDNGTLTIAPASMGGNVPCWDSDLVMTHKVTGETIRGKVSYPQSLGKLEDNPGMAWEAFCLLRNRRQAEKGA